MLNSIFRKKIAPQVYAEDIALANLEPVEYQVEHDEESKNSKTIYYRPKISAPKLFAPDQWSVDNFQIGKHLGKGKYGHVYLARERKTKHLVALKVLSKKQIVNCDVVNQIRRELEIHSHIKHENILRMYGFFFDERKIYIIMEYADGGQLYAELKKVGRFSEKTVATYISHTLKAMRHLHSLNIIHRDLKPENILICNGNVAKMTDFGWSVHTSKSRKTFCGTIDYIAPEIIRRESYDTDLDLWTVGVLTYELASGRAPFESGNRIETSKKIKMLDYSFPQYFSPELEDFIQKMLTSDPKKRMNEEHALVHPWIIKNTSE